MASQTKIKPEDKLKEMVKDIKFYEKPRKRKFNMNEFKKEAKKVRNTFKDEDLARFRISI